MMLSKLWALFAVFRKGSALSDPELWRDRGSAVNALVGLLAASLAALASFGHKVEVSNDDLQAVALGVVAVVGIANKLLHVATHVDAGLPPKPDAHPSAPLFEHWPVIVDPSPDPEPKEAEPDNSVRDGRPPYLQ